MSFKDLVLNILNKKADTLSLRELAMKTRYNVLSQTMEDEALFEQLENEYKLANEIRTNASVSNTSIDAGGAKELIPENVLMSDLIDMGDNQEDYAFLFALLGKHTLSNKKQTVPIIGRARRGRVLSQQANSEQFRKAKDGIQSGHSDETEIIVSKLYNNIQLTDELVTFSLIQLEALYLGKIKEGLLLDMANAILNGDTANTTGNINNKGVAPATTYGAEYNQLSEYAFDNSIRKVGLAGSNGVTKKSVGAVSGANDIIRLQSLVTSTRNPKKKIIVMDQSTYYLMLEKDDFKKMCDNGKDSTIYSGAITNIAGSDLFVTGLLAKAGTDGKVDISTPANNVTGTILVFDISCIQHGDFDVLKFNNDTDFAVSTLLETYGYWGFSNINGKDGLNFLAVGYNVTA